MARTKKSGFRRCPICGHHADRKDIRETAKAETYRAMYETLLNKIIQGGQTDV